MNSKVKANIDEELTEYWKGEIKVGPFLMSSAGGNELSVKVLTYRGKFVKSNLQGLLSNPLYNDTRMEALVELAIKYTDLALKELESE